MAKKLLAVILSVLMLASVFSVSVSAADEKSAFEAKVESALGILIGNGEKVDVQVDADLLSALSVRQKQRPDVPVSLLPRCSGWGYHGRTY